MKQEISNGKEKLQDGEIGIENMEAESMEKSQNQEDAVAEVNEEMKDEELKDKSEEKVSK